MNITLRRVDPAGRDPELLLLGATAGCAAYGAAWVAARLPMPQCAFHSITGYPCPTCGATRCVLALFHGHIGEAFGWNPLVFTGLILLAIFNLYAAAVVTAGLPRLRVALGPLDWRFLRVGFMIIIAANWAYEIHRLG
jgi:hypothetical protein